MQQDGLEAVDLVNRVVFWNWDEKLDVIRILLLINIEMGGNKLNWGDEGSEKDQAKYGTLWDTGDEYDGWRDVLADFHILEPLG